LTAFQILRVATPGRYAIWTSAEAMTISQCVRESIPLAPTSMTLDVDAIPPTWLLPFRAVPGGSVVVLEFEVGDYEIGTAIAGWAGPETHSVEIDPASSIVPLLP
jgi:hypothetical protein